jgi:ribosomal protein S18 acetylase RimI-like enzyme
MSQPDLVRLGPDEWRVFREVRLASLADAPYAFGASHAQWVDASEERWRSRLTDVPFTVVARSDGLLVGVVSGVSSGEHVELISMWVAPDQRDTGLAGRLIGEVVAWADAMDQDTMLMVRDDNAPAIRAYERAGFTDLGVPPDHPQEAPPERRMHRPRA